MKQLVDSVKTWVRGVLHIVARWLNAVSKGKITPNGVTIFGVIMHVPIALLIGSGHFIWAAVLLVIFGLFDTLDGELARLQHRASVQGMLLDASTDRMKEVMLYAGAGYYLAQTDMPTAATWAVIACGASLCVSYVKAKGEAAVASGGKAIPHATLNRMFADGLLTFEMRMVVLILGLITGLLVWAVAIIAVLATYTAIQRLVRISAKV